MCLIVFDWQPSKTIRLRLAANRDEFHSRPTRALHRWQDLPLVGGRDLAAGGTWLAVSGGRRFAAVTNVRSGDTAMAGRALSRGDLVRQALTAPHPHRWLTELASGKARQFAGFNLLVGFDDQLWHVHHAGRHGVCHDADDTLLQRVPPGIHTLSNATLDSTWPKSVRAGSALAETLPTTDWRPVMRQTMRDARPFADDTLPDTSVGLARERTLSPLFIEGADYGTRAMTLVTWSNEGIELEETGFGPMGKPLDTTTIVSR
ncbi:NRDE family protein [Salinicola rhizosphaerae]|uniref:NRDE family protein n=1 Tax=Salinicola rhizosphaerae TaxID=1443141 RepID=A0ABQ3E6S5_9GAMM|nr:NRDE family protein [Salinicola rhizosphaerae]GHB24994.1 hypothetical protein GCM10009038_25110 [Salinicola rhizosphaerae]